MTANMAGSDDGTLWMLVNVHAAKYDLPADFDPNTMNKYDYPSTDMSTAYSCTLPPTAARSPMSTFLRD